MLLEYGLLEKEKDGARLIVKSDTSYSLKCAGKKQIAKILQYCDECSLSKLHVGTPLHHSLSFPQNW